MQNSNGQVILLDSLRFDPKQSQAIAPAVPSGTWTLQATVVDGQGHRLEARQEFTVGHADATGLQLLFHSTVSIPIAVNRPGSNESEPTLLPLRTAAAKERS
jgi:hypothetical protein